MTKKTKQITARLELNIGDTPYEFEISVPTGKTGAEAALPFARELTNKIVEVAAHDAQRNGERIACSKGCGACCAQLVPVSETEARLLGRYVQSQPDSRRTTLLERFHQAKAKLEQAEMWQDLIQPQPLSLEDSRALALRYFALNIPCPFLEDGACSIHPQRPLTCREFLVTSDARHCSNPNPQDVKTVSIPKRVSNAYARLYENDPHYVSNWVPLITAPYWTASHPAQPSQRKGPEWIEALLAKVQNDAE